MKVDDLTSVIERAQQRNADALDVLVDEYSARLYGFLLRLTGSREDAEDLVQEVFVRVVRMIGRYDHRGYFEQWLFRIATNLARDRLRRITRAPQMVSLDTPAALGDLHGGGGDQTCKPSGQAPESGFERAEALDRLQWALGKLPEPEREVLMLRHYGQMSFSQIAELMGTPLGTALARAHRALGQLRDWLESS